MLTTYIFVFSAALFFTLLTTPVVRWVALHFNVLDVPNSRKVHLDMTPRLGGLGIYFGMLLAFIVILSFSPIARELIFQNSRQCISLLAGATLLCAVGAVDDIRGLKAWTKLLYQISAGVIAYLGGLQFHFAMEAGSIHPLWTVINLVVTIFWITIITNSINLIDGLDGLASGITTIVVLILCAIAIRSGYAATAVLAMVLAGSVVGFLRYNIYPAKIFLGDSGSLLLGYLLAALTLHGTQGDSPVSSLIIASFLLSVPLLDTSMAVVRRFLKGHAIFFADGNHIHHKLLKRDIEHPRAVMILWGATLMFGAMAFLYSYFKVGLQRDIINLFSIVLLGVLAWNFSSTEIKGLIQTLRRNNQRRLSPREKNLLVRKYIHSLKRIREPEDFKQHIISLAEKIEIDSLRIIIGIDKDGSPQDHELIHWLKQSETNSHRIKESKVCYTYSGPVQVKCTVFLGKQHWKLRRKSEEDHIWGRILADGIGANYLRIFGSGLRNDQYFLNHLYL